MAACKSSHILDLLIVVATVLFIMADAKSAKTKNPASDYFDLCRRRDPNVSACIMKNIIDLKPKLIKGIPDLRLVPLDPLVIPEMALSEGEGNYRFTQNVKNFTINGLGAYTVKSVDYVEDGVTANMDVTLTVPTLSMTGYYVIDGRILVLPIRGEGDLFYDLKDITAMAHVKGRVVQKSGEEHIVVDDFKWDIGVGGARFQLNNLFNGDKLLGDTTNRFLNENWEEAVKAYKHLPEEAFGVVFKGFASQVYKRYTLRELFLE